MTRINFHRPRAFLIGLGLKSQPFQEIKDSLSELEELANAAHYEVVGVNAQALTQWVSATLLGSGKVQQITEQIKDCEADLVIVDHHLTGVQQRNLTVTFGVRVLDRNQLILDIFARRAQTYEGKLQVQLAQLLDQLPRMVGAWLGSLSRQGGGIGTRGPGETALEMDRRQVQKRVKQIRKKLEDVRQHRSQHRSFRKKQKVPSFALVGYTNSGKSTLMRQLCKADVFVQDQAFATLDPTTRKVFLNGNSEAVVTDTVGFIRNLPPQLIEAFKATLEETTEADILIHVVDLSSPNMDRQIEAVDKLIEEFGWNKKPIIHVYNKVDIASTQKKFTVKSKGPRVFVSAVTGEGLDRLKQIMISLVEAEKQNAELYFPHGEEDKIFELNRDSVVKRQERASQGTICYAQLTANQLDRWKEYVVQVR